MQEWEGRGVRDLGEEAQQKVSNRSFVCVSGTFTSRGIHEYGIDIRINKLANCGAGLLLFQGLFEASETISFKPE